jgi:peroxiredoxin Q/BCP
MNPRLRRALGAVLSVFSIAAAAAVPAVGTQAPAFSLPDQHGKLRQLNDWRGQWVVLYFYPKDDTPGCTTEACNFRDDWLQLSAMKAQVVGISVDSSTSHQAFAEKYHLPFPLLADVKGEVAVRYGAISDWKLFKFAKRYTFLIDPQGRIAKTYLSVNAARHSTELMADLLQLQAGTR